MAAITPQDLERVRGYIVHVLLNAGKEQNLSREQIKTTAQAVLAKTANLTDSDQLTTVMEELTIEFPVLQKATIQNLEYADEQIRDQAVAKMHELLKNL